MYVSVGSVVAVRIAVAVDIASIRRTTTSHRGRPPGSPTEHQSTLNRPKGRKLTIGTEAVRVLLGLCRLVGVN